MYFSLRLVPAFKSRNLIECPCNGERRQTLYLGVCDSFEVTTNKTNKANNLKTQTIDEIMYKQTGVPHWSVSRIKSLN